MFLRISKTMLDIIVEGLGKRVHQEGRSGSALSKVFSCLANSKTSAADKENEICSAGLYCNGGGNKWKKSAKQ